MDFTELYAQKKMTADQAAALVKSGDWVDYGWAVNTPVAVDAAIAKRLPELENVNFRGGILMWVPEIFQIDDPAAHMTWNSWHMGGIERKAIAQGFSFYSPIRYSELPRYYRESPDPLDVAVFQVTPMDEHGYFNFGPCASHLGAVCDKAKKIIVEVNRNMPKCLGGTENWVHISQVAGVVEGSNPPIGQMAAPGAATEVDLAVANLIVPQIPNGACLQLGIGGMPNAIGNLIAQSDLKDLGVHTEMYVDAFVDIAKGVSCFLPLEEAKNAVFTKKNGKKDLCIGDELLVEVTREKQKNKPASVSANLNFSGKYLILTTGNHLLGISKKLHATERERLQALLKDQITDTFGIVVRTAAKDASDEEILKELEMLTKQCHACLQGAMHRTAFTRLREAPPFYLQFLKNRNLTEVQKITTDIPSVHEVLLQHLQDTKEAEKLHLYTDTQVSLFALYSLTHELERALHRQVWLPSGAYLVIDPTEALTVIDVNTGKAVDGRRNKETTFYKINCEAAIEAARQIRLRNLSGIILIDFIDMKEQEHVEELMQLLRMKLSEDKVKTVLVDITKLGLVEITRMKKNPPLREALSSNHLLFNYFI